MDQNAGLVGTFVVAFVVAVFVAAAEAALLRMTPARATALAESSGRRGRRLISLVEDLPRVLSTILLTALLAQITAATVTGILADRWFGSVGVTVASIALTIALFIYGEAIPKTFAVRNSDQVALWMSGPVTALERALRPIVAVLVWFADLQAPGQGVTTSPTVTERELRILAGHAAQEGTIDEEDQRLIERAFRLGDRQTDDIMVPRTEIIGVPAETTVAEAIDVALEAGHRRLPVFDDHLDNITGVVRLRDLAGVPVERQHLAVAHLATEPLVVPETKRVVDLLREMQSKANHFAIVVDEYGGVAGLATVEDIAEELMGSISAGAAHSELVAAGPGRWTAAGLLPVEDLAAALDIELPEGDWNTVGGLVVAELGRIPSVGDYLDIEGYHIRVIATRGRRINRVEVTRI